MLIRTAVLIFWYFSREFGLITESLLETSKPHFSQVGGKQLRDCKRIIGFYDE